MVALSIILIVCVACLAFFFAPEDTNGYPRGRFVFVVGCTWFATCLVIAYWVGFVLVHFIQKYW